MISLLLVDDEIPLVIALANIMEAYGYQVRAMTSGPDCLSAIEEELPALVISDVVMPDMSGPEMLEAVRQRPEYGELPFIFISAFVTGDEESRLRDMPLVWYISKPFEINALLDLVAEILGRPQ